MRCALSCADVDVDQSVRDEVNKAASNTDLLEDVELENKTIKWMATWDINPDASGKNKPTELVVFEEKYGGNIEYHQVTWENRYEKLAESISSGEGSAGRASALHAEGQEFDPPHLHHLEGRIAQVVRAHA